jgi:hypothetical protein
MLSFPYPQNPLSNCRFVVVVPSYLAAACISEHNKSTMSPTASAASEQLVQEAKAEHFVVKKTSIFRFL